MDSLPPALSGQDSEIGRFCECGAEIQRHHRHETSRAKRLVKGMDGVYVYHDTIDEAIHTSDTAVSPPAKAISD
jgi:hypothetical protein